MRKYLQSADRRFRGRTAWDLVFAVTALHEITTLHGDGYRIETAADQPLRFQPRLASLKLDKVTTFIFGTATI